MIDAIVPHVGLFIVLTLGFVIGCIAARWGKP